MMATAEVDSKSKAGDTPLVRPHWLNINLKFSVLIPLFLSYILVIIIQDKVFSLFF